MKNYFQYQLVTLMLKVEKPLELLFLFVQFNSEYIDKHAVLVELLVEADLSFSLLRQLSFNLPTSFLILKLM